MEVLMELGGPTGPGGGAHLKMGPMPQPRGTIDTASRTLYHTYSLTQHAFSEPTLLYLHS